MPLAKGSSLIELKGLNSTPRCPDWTHICIKFLFLLQETQVPSVVWEDSLEEAVATHSSILAWRIPWTEEPGRLQQIGLQGVRHDSSDLACMYALVTNYHTSDLKQIPVLKFYNKLPCQWLKIYMYLKILQKSEVSLNYNYDICRTVILLDTPEYNAFLFLLYFSGHQHFLVHGLSSIFKPRCRAFKNFYLTLILFPFSSAFRGSL